MAKGLKLKTLRNLPPVAGYERLSLCDWPGRVAAVLFLQGCNFRCQWCHNSSLVYPEFFTPPLGAEEVESFILSLDPFLYDGVVVSGGEPLIHPKLVELLLLIKRKGLKVRLDTNGSLPGQLQSLFDLGLVDEVAVDYKVPLGLYEVVGAPGAGLLVKETIALVAERNTGYVRTTVVPGVHTSRMLSYMAGELGSVTGDRLRWVLQPYRKPPAGREADGCRSIA